MDEDDAVFKALADPTRRHLLDRLKEGGSLTQKQLEQGVELSRFGVAKHLRVLEEAGLVVIRRVGREKRHELNAVPIRRIHDRWISKYAALRSSALLELQERLEKETGEPHGQYE